LRLAGLNSKKEQSDRMSREREFFINYVKKFTKFETLDRTALVRPIIKIYIYEDRTIHIHYNFRSTKEA
jgi:hypothetical protein